MNVTGQSETLFCSDGMKLILPKTMSMSMYQIAIIINLFNVPVWLIVLGLLWL